MLHLLRHRAAAVHCNGVRVCRVQWHVVSFQHGRWSCSCVVCWKDKAMARASDGWHSTSTEFIYAGSCCYWWLWNALLCRSILLDDWLFHGLLLEPFCYVQCVCMCVLFLLFQTVCSVVSLYSECNAQHCINEIDFCQFIGWDEVEFVELSYVICVECVLSSSMTMVMGNAGFVSSVWLGIDIICLLRNLYMSLFICKLVIILRFICICCDYAYNKRCSRICTKYFSKLLGMWDLV